MGDVSGQAMTDRAVVTRKGPAAGRLTSVSCLTLYVADAAAALDFYCGILGMKLVKTVPAPASGGSRGIGSTSFLEMSSGSLLGLIEYPSMPVPSPSVLQRNSTLERTENVRDGKAVGMTWPWPYRSPTLPQKVDHVSFDVKTREEVYWFHQHLRDSGVPTGPIIDFLESSGLQFVLTFFFYDPSGNPVEISTFQDLDARDIPHDERFLFEDDRAPALMFKND